MQNIRDYNPCGSRSTSEVESQVQQPRVLAHIQTLAAASGGAIVTWRWSTFCVREVAESSTSSFFFPPIARTSQIVSWLSGTYWHNSVFLGSVQLDSGLHCDAWLSVLSRDSMFPHAATPTHSSLYAEYNIRIFSSFGGAADTRKLWMPPWCLWMMEAKWSNTC